MHSPRFARLAGVILMATVPASAWAASDPASTAPSAAACPAQAYFRTHEPKETVAAFLQGADVHSAGAARDPLPAASAQELEVEALALAMKDRFATSLGAARFAWELQNPVLDADAARARQDAVRELIANPELGRQIRQVLERIRQFEQRDSRWDNLVRRAAGPIERRFKIPLSEVLLPKREVSTPFKLFSKADPLQDSAFFQKFPYLLDLYRAAFWPVIYGAQYVKQVKPFVSFIAPYGLIRNAGTQSSVRRELGQLKLVNRSLRELNQAVATGQAPAFAAHRELLAAVEDPSHEFRLRGLSRGLNRLITNRLLSFPMDMAFISNFSLFKMRQKVRTGLYQLATLTSVLAELDMLVTFADLAREPGFTLPEILPDGTPTRVEIRMGRQPLLHLLGRDVVPNDFAISATPTEAVPQVMFITGPNARGKSTYSRMVAQMLILGSIGAPVPAEAMSFSILHLSTTMANSDSTVNNESRFRAEARRVAGLLKDLETRPASLVILDEVFSGTSGEEKKALETALLLYLQKRGHVVISASHNRDLVDLEGKVPGFMNFHASDDDGRMYQIERGPSRLRNAFDVLREEGAPAELLNLADEVYEGPREELRSASGG